MADVIKTITIRGKTEGVNEATAALKGLASAQDGVAKSGASTATVTDTSSKSQISLADALAKAERRFNSTLRAQQDFEKIQRQMNLAVQQNPALQERANAVLALARDHFDRVGKAANDNNTALDRLGNTLTRRVIFAFLIKEMKDVIAAAFNLNAELAKVGDVARRIGTTGGAAQGLEFAAVIKGVSSKEFLDSMLKFNDQVDQAKAGLGSLGALFRANGIAVKDTVSSFLSVSDLVKNAATESQKFSILQQAGLSPTREMVRLMEQGSASIRKQASEAEKFTQQQLDRAQELDDKFNAMWAGFVRGAKKAFLDAADFPPAGTPLADFMDMASGKKPWSIKFDLTPPPGSNLEKLLNLASGKSLAVPVVPVQRGEDLAAPAGTRLTVNPNPTIDPARLKELMGLEQQRIGILGQMATVEQQVRSVEIGIQTARIGGVNVTKAEEAALLALARARADGTFALKAQIDAANVQAAVIGKTVAQAEAYSIVQTKINENLNAGRPALDGVTDAFRKLAEQAGQVKQNGELAVAVDQAQFDAKTVFLSALEKEIALLEKRNGITPQTQEIASIKRTTDGLKQAQDAATSFGQSLAQGLMNGKSLAESLTAALNNLAAMAANAAIKNLLEGNFTMAAIDAAVAISAKLASMFTDDSQAKELEKAKQNFADMAGEITKFNAAAAGFNLSPIVDELSSLTQQWVKLGTAAGDARDFGKLKELNQTFEHGVGRIIDSYMGLNAALSDSGKQIAQAKADALGMADALHQAGMGMSQASDLAQFGLVKAIDRIKNALAGNLQSEIDTARGSGFLNDIRTLVANDNKLKAEGNVSSDLIQLHFATVAQKIIDDAGLIGDSFQSLVTQFPDLSGAVHESATALADQAKAAQDAADKQTEAAQRFQESLNSAAKGIVDYVNNLRAGPESSLSPSARLAVATQTSNATLGLAQGGNVDALNRITSDIDNELKAARAFYGSSAAYQSIEQQRIAQLLALPAVTTSTDPVVQALLDVQTKIQATTTAVGGTTAAVGGTTTAVGGTTAAANATKTSVDAGNSLLNATYSLLASSNTIASNTYQSLEFQRVAQGQLLGQLQNIQTNTSNTVTAIQAMQHIVGHNTYLVGYNQRVAASHASPAGWSGEIALGIDAATGGWVKGGIANKDSVRINAMPDEFIVRKSATDALVSAYGGGVMDIINQGRLPSNVIPFPTHGYGGGSDNSALVSELKGAIEMLTRQVAALEMSNSRGHNRTAAKVGENTAHREETADRDERDRRLAARRSKAA